ncbi:hypothetical protein BH23THE1_BH23THE1_23010 [soil metagenome]
MSYILSIYKNPMNKLSTVSHSFRIYILLSIILVGSLTFNINNIHGLFLFSTASGQEVSITINTTDLINQGKYLNNIGNYTEALTYFDKVLSVDPNNTEALHGKGLTIDNFGNHTDAVEIYDEILTIDPDNMDTLASKGVVLYNTGNHAEAITNFEKVLTLNSSTSNRSMFDKGVSYYGLGKYQDAIDYFKKSLDVDPNNTLTLNNLGFA